MNPFRNSKASKSKDNAVGSQPVRSNGKAFLFFLTLSVALSAFSQTKAGNRINQGIDDRDTIPLRGNVHPLLQKATDQGRMDGGTRLEGVSLVFKRTAAQEAAAEKLLADQQNPSSASYHKWLTPEQYADRFGLSQADLDKVTSWLRSQGFTVNRTARGRTQVWFSGTVSQIETEFRTEMHHFMVKGEAHFANSVEPSVPSALGEVVMGVHGLSNFRPKPRVRMNRALADTVKPNFNLGNTGTHFMSPDDWTTIYDVKALYTAGFDGTGQSIAIAGQSEVNNTDLNAFRTAAGLPTISASNFERKLVPGSEPAVVVSGDIGESSIDLEWSNAVARGAKVIFVYTGNGGSFNVFDAFTYAIDQNLAPILSMSYGNCEQNLPSAFLTSVQQLTQQAAMQGQTIAAASGDFGAADCDTAPGLPAQGGLGIDIPGALPYVTSVGGSGFNGDIASPATFWNSANNGVGGSAKSYIGETTWNNTVQRNLLSAGGGGASILFSKPSWQTGTGVPNDGARDVPDIALAADPDHDGYMLCVNDPGQSQLPCTNSGFLDSTGAPDVAGGTSFGSPTFSGIVAILNQKTGTRQGNINPALYALSAANVGAFHDITTGSNIVPCDRATADCPQSGTAQYGFSAGVGYDQVTGLGSIDAAVLVNNWSSGNPTVADFSMFGDTVGISAPGGSGTSTITVDGRNGYNGTITFTCAVSSLTAKIGCTVSGGPLILNPGTPKGTVTLSITTASATAVPSSAPLWLGGSGALVAGVFVFGIPARRRRWGVVLTLTTITFILSAVGCGGSSKSSGGGTGTPAGTYVVSVTGSDGTASHTTEVAVAVQ
jgi:subtilase family serine protease